MKCPKCSTENPEGLTFCGQCGAKLERVCLKCKFSNPVDSKYCGKCGNALEELQVAPPIDYSKPKSYTPKFLADKILTTRSSIEGERKLVTVLFADVANFTPMAKKLDPEEVHQIMDGCFRILMDEIHKYEGTINQFTGDGVMALFGAPVAHEDHAQRACYATLSIQNTLRDYGEKLKKECGVDFKMRIGLNSGPVVVGSIGDDLRMDYTAIGDTINLASRMETTAKPGTVLVSGHTYKLARDYFKFESLGKIQVKGKEEPQDAYELLAPSEVKTRIEAAAVAGLTKFVGRRREMEALQEALEKVRSGSGQVVGIVGEAGVGKSRLILEMRKIFPKEEYGYLEGRCLHYRGSIAYLPILDILRSYFNVKEGMQRDILKGRIEETIVQADKKLLYLLPPLHELFSLTVEDESYAKLDPIQKRQKMFEAVRDLFFRESQKKPLILAIEDLHWIDKTSESFLTYLIGWLANARILLILLYRPDYNHSWGNRSYYNRIGLDQLPMAARNELLQSLLTEAEVSSGLRELLLSKAGGNPLFIEELTNALLESGYIEKEEKRYKLSRRVGEIQVPETLQGIIAARMDRLEENLKRTMQVASVIGRKFAFSIIETLSGVKGEIKSHLTELQGLEFIYEKSLFPELEYEFKHTLVQEVAYNSLLLRRRREIHEQVGKAIETLYPNRMEEFYEILAYHYSKSEDTEKAYKYMKLSGIKATRNSALWEAFRFYQESINLLIKKPLTDEGKHELIEICLLMASPMISLGFPEDSLRILQDGERLSREIGSTKNLTTICSIIGLYYSVKGEPVAGAKYGEECLGIAEKEQDIRLTAPIVFDLCSNYVATGQFLKVIEMAPRILSLLEQTKGEYECFDRGYNIYSALAAFYGLSLGYMGDFEEGKIFCEKALHAALKVENLYSLGLTEVLYGFLFGNKGDGKEAQQHFGNSIRYLEKGQIFVLLGLSWSGLGWAHYLLNDLENARVHMEKGLKLHLDTGISYNLSLHYWLLSMVSMELNEMEKAQEYAVEALRFAQKNNELYYVGLSMIVLGRIQAQVNISQSERAEESILKGIKILDELKVKIYHSVGDLWLGELYGNTNRREKALEALKTAEGVFLETGMDYWLAKTQVVLKSL
jgi:class 3 adenylate cyclase/tetratricopeptide (TPR) repeat protein